MKDEKIYRIENIDCPVCAGKIAKHLEESPKVRSASIDYAASRLFIDADFMTTAEIEEAISEVEGGVKVLELDKKREPFFKRERHLLVTGLRAATSFIMAITTFFLVNPETGLALYVSLMAIAWLISGYDLLFKAFKGIFKGRDIFNESLLMCVASIGAFLLPLLNNEFEVMFDAALVVVLFQIGEIFEHVAAKRSHRAIIDALSLKTQIIDKIVDGEIVKVDPSSLKIGDLVLVKVGESIPSDGKVEEGIGDIDLSSLTGESLPIAISEGSEVYGGAILRSGSVKVRISKEYKDSASQKIIELVENSNREKSKTERFITRFSRIYTPIVFSLALLITVSPPLFIGISSGEVWASWLRIGLSFLVVSCPCAIVIATPLTFFAGIGKMSKKGIIVKGSEHLDRLSAIKTVVSDKTGTLTEGKFTIIETKSVGICENKFLGILGAIESRSTHPLAVASARYASRDLLSKIEKYEELPGQGIKATIAGVPYAAGNEIMMEELGVGIEKPEKPGSVIYVAENGKLLGYSVLGDTIRNESSIMVKELKKMGIKTTMLTGDKKEPALEIADQLGIDNVHYGLFPEGKTLILKSEIRDGVQVAFIGDGINDAPSLALADVGIAMGGIGSDAAMESADVIIMNDDPSRVPLAIKMAKFTRNWAIGLIVFSLIVKVGIMVASLIIGSMGGEMPLWVAVLGDTGVTIMAVLLAFFFMFIDVNDPFGQKG